MRERGTKDGYCVACEMYVRESPQSSTHLPSTPPSLAPSASTSSTSALVSDNAIVQRATPAYPSLSQSIPQSSSPVASPVPSAALSFNSSALSSSEAAASSSSSFASTRHNVVSQVGPVSQAITRERHHSMALAEYNLIQKEIEKVSEKIRTNESFNINDVRYLQACVECAATLYTTGSI